MSDLSLLLFAVKPDVVREACRSGITGIVVDWEVAGKARRQHGADTEINHHTPDDLLNVRRATSARVICRINGLHEESRAEIDLAISLGADELLLPMVREVDEVDRALDLVKGRRPLGILIETGRAVQNAEALCARPLSRVYVGLNDLAIDRGAPNIFTALADGTVEHVQRVCPLPFGFGGLTLPDGGWPIPCRLLIGETARLQASFSFLRRSFYRDMVGRRWEEEVPRLLEALRAARERTHSAMLADHAEFVVATSAWPSVSRPAAALSLHV